MYLNGQKSFEKMVMLFW